MHNLQSQAAHAFSGYLRAAEAHFQKHSQGMTKRNHYQHNLEPDFWRHMILPLLSEPEKYRGSLAMEYGCGAGRNLVNLLTAAPILRADGIDISKDNAINSQAFVDLKFGSGKSICLEGNGWSCLPFPSNSYLWIISHQVFIHIPNRSIRLSILIDFHRTLKVGGSAVVHFKAMDGSVPYLTDHDSFPKNVTVTESDIPLIHEDFEIAGFTDVRVETGKNFVDGGLEIWVTAVK